MKRTIAYISALMLLAACVYPYEVQTPPVDRTVVIDGDILIGQESTFKTSYVASLDKYTQDPAMGDFRVECSDGTVYLPEHEGVTAVFKFDLTNADPDCRYRVVFKCQDNGKTYSSNWEDVAPAPRSAALHYKRNTASITIYAAVNFRDEVGYVRSTYSQVWEYTADYPMSCAYDPETNSIQDFMMPDYSLYFCWNQSEPSSSIIATNEGKKEYSLPNAVVTEIARTDRRLSSLYYIKARVYGLTKEAYDYIKNLDKISNVSGDLFTPTPSEQRGNITCEEDPSEFVIGYVSASAFVDADLYIKSSGIYTPVNATRFLFEPLPEITLAEYYEMGYVPVKHSEVNKETWVWGPRRCVDCRGYGGTKEKPEGWPTINN